LRRCRPVKYLAILVSVWTYFHLSARYYCPILTEVGFFSADFFRKSPQNQISQKLKKKNPPVGAALIFAVRQTDRYDEVNMGSLLFTRTHQHKRIKI